jgi:hypothetical protein
MCKLWRGSMKFKETCLYKVMVNPVDYIAENSIYYSILRMPYFILNYTVGIVIAICLDFYVAMTSK